MSKRETVEEFLQRGGTITKVPAQEPPVEDVKTASSKNGTSQMMSLSDGGLYYAECKPRKASKKVPPKTINFSALPAHLMRFIPSRSND